MKSDKEILIEKQLDYLDKVLNTFNSNNRAEIIVSCENTTCVYHPTETSPGCAIGFQILPEEYNPVWDIEPTPVEDIFTELPQRFQDLGKQFLMEMQAIHDTSKYWTTEGFNYERYGDKADKIKEQITEGFYDN